MAGAAYEIDLVDLDGQAGFRLAGEFDLANAPELRDRLLSLLAREWPVVVDMGDVSYIDSAALGVFMEASKRAAAVGTTFRLVNVTGAAERVLEITGLDDLLVGPDLARGGRQPSGELAPSDGARRRGAGAAGGVHANRGAPSPVRDATLRRRRSAHP